jgi:hypothetical protein
VDLNLSRATGEGAAEPGQEGVITRDTYKGWAVFGLRVID